MYFWKDLQKISAELFRVTVPGGLTAVYYVSPIMEPSVYFHEYSEEEITNALRSAGFSEIAVHRKQFDKQNGICIIAKK